MSNCYFCSSGECVQIRSTVEDCCWAGGAGGCQDHAEQSRGVLPYQCGGTRSRHCHLTSTHHKTSISNYFCLSSPAVAGIGPVRDVWERTSCPEQSSRKHPHRSPHLDHRCQVGGGQRQHSDGGQDHWQSHHFSARQWCGDQQRAVDTGVFLQLSGFFERAGFPAAVMWQRKTFPCRVQLPPRTTKSLTRLQAICSRVRKVSVEQSASYWQLLLQHEWCWFYSIDLIGLSLTGRWSDGSSNHVACIFLKVPASQMVLSNKPVGHFSPVERPLQNNWEMFLIFYLDHKHCSPE